MILKNHLVLALLIITSCFDNLGAQSLSNPNSIQFKSPQAASVEKIGLVPTNLSTGQINPSIEIYNFSTPELDIPIRLNYSNTGLKIGENATWVGLGWNLLVGGVISQNVKGIPDDGPVGMLYGTPNNDLARFLNNQMSSFEKDNYLYNVMNYQEDSEKDIFTFNFMGRSGSFFFDFDGTLRQFQRNDLKITYTLLNNQINTFTILDERGFSFFFSVKEMSSYSDIDPAANSPLMVNGNSWYLASITTPTNDVFSFVYDNDVTLMETHDSYSLSFGQTGSSSCSVDYSLTNIQVNEQFPMTAQKKIKEINCQYGKIVFNTQAIREDLKDVNGQKAQALTEIVIQNAYGRIIKKAIFSYGHFKNDLGQDKNRLKLKNLSLCGNDCNTPLVYEFTYNNEENSFPPLQLSKDFDHWGYYNGANNSVPLPSFNASNIAGLGGNYYGADKNSNSFYSRFGMLKSIKYPTGGTSEFEYEGNTTDISGYNPLPVFISTTNPSSYQVGGNRIKTITYKDNNSTVQSKQIYDYSVESGLKYIPNYLIIREYIINVSFGFNSCGNTFFVSDRPQNSMPGFHIEYSYVIEKNETNGINGYTKYTFSKSSDIGSQSQPFPTVINSCWRSGQPIVAEVFKKEASGQYTSIQKTSNLFTSSYYYPMTLGLTSLKIARRITGTSTFNPTGIAYYETGAYTYFTEQTSLDQTIKIDYSATDQITTTVSSFYESPYHFEKTRETMILSNGNTKEAKYYYVKDFDNSAGTSIADLKTKNINSLIRLDRFNASALTSSKINILNSVGNMTATYSSLISSPTSGTSASSSSFFRSGVNYQNEDNVTYTANNRLGTINHLGMNKSYLWGYNKTYPVAEITNADYATASSYITQSILDNPTDDVSLISHLNNLRNIPNAQVTTYTYKPLVGITSTSDINNTTTYFIYDAFNRLAIIKDKDGNVVKKLCYNYLGQPGTCSIYGNAAKNGTFTKNDCSSGSGTSVTYTVPANTYYASTQPDADVIAQNDVNTNGQAYANANGTCTAPQVTVNGQSYINTPYTVSFYNTSTGQTYNMFLYPYSSSSISVPIGNYNVSFNAFSGSIYTYFTINGYGNYGTSANFYNVSIGSGSYAQIGYPN